MAKPSRQPRKATLGETRSAQVFLAPPETDEDLGTEAARCLRDAMAAVKAAPEAASLGKVHPLARSFSVQAVPEVIAALEKAPGVRAVLANEQPDLLIRPVRRRREA
jgi:hypothetical protein